MIFWEAKSLWKDGLKIVEFRYNISKKKKKVRCIDENRKGEKEMQKYE